MRCLLARQLQKSSLRSSLIIVGTFGNFHVFLLESCGLQPGAETGARVLASLGHECAGAYLLDLELSEVDIIEHGLDDVTLCGRRSDFPVFPLVGVSV